MKNAIREYLSLTEEEKRMLWDKAVFVFDTNIFLNLYRYTEDTRASLLKAMKELSDRIWMPKKVAQEFMKDRTKVILDTLNMFDKIEDEKKKFIDCCSNSLNMKSDNDVICKISKAMDNHIESLKKEANFIEKIDDDRVLCQLLNLYENKVGSGFSDDEIEIIKKEGVERYKKTIPPGYRDYKKGEENNAFGDLIIWKEVLSYSSNNKKHIIFVTADNKEDWWETKNGKTLGPRPELIKEFFVETNQLFYMYSMDRFLNQFKLVKGSSIHQSTIDEVKTHEQLIKANRYNEVRQKAQSNKLRHINSGIHSLQSELQQLNKYQNTLELDIKEFQESFKIQEALRSENIEELEKANKFLDEYGQKIVRMEELMRRQFYMQKELEKLEYEKKELIDLYERNEDEFN